VILTASKDLPPWPPPNLRDWVKNKYPPYCLPHVQSTLWNFPLAINTHFISAFPNA
jgi:hypothetical protein